MFLNSFVRSRLCYSCQKYDRLDVAYRVLLRRMVRGGFRFFDESNGDFRHVINNDRLYQIMWYVGFKFIYKVATMHCT